MLKAVLFDLDGTLFDRDSSVRRLVASQYDAFAQELRPVARQTFVERFVTLDRRGYVPKQQVYRDLVRQLGITGVTATTLFSFWQAHFHDRCALFPAAAATLDQLAKAGLSLGLITNGGFPWQLHTVQALGIEHHFGTILVSEAEGLRKPDRTIFALATQRLGVAPDQAVYVGDHPAVDIAGARNAGLRTVWKRDTFWDEPAEADAVVDDLGCLPDILRQMAGDIG